MNETKIDLKNLIKPSLFALLVIIISLYGTVFDSRTKIVFCDVGQGDAAYIRVKNKTDLLIDAGPNRQVLACLGKYMPFWDRKIELAVISHPQKDHFGGLLYLADRYQIEKLLMGPLDSNSQSFKQLKEKIREKKISLDFPTAGTRIKAGDDFLSFYWPTKEFLAKNITYRQRSLAIGTANVLGASTLDDNNFSLIFLFEESNFRVLFTGDATPEVLNDLIIDKVDVLKTPHHGSKNGLTEKFLRLAGPAVAVISVGKNNAYGHPAKEIIEILKASKTKIKRTDVDGDIVFKLTK